jgi:predicted nucleotidyltransferase component of viral defense system
MNNLEYRERIKLLLQLIPIVSEIDDFAIHGGTAINLFVLDLPRYSVDIDVTYIPIKSREDIFSDIRSHLAKLNEKIKRLFSGIVIEEKPNKINCLLNGILVKIEINGTKRALIEPSLVLPLCDSAQMEFKTFCEAKIVSVSQLYGGKISAALDRQHPRDLFDIKLMFDKITGFSDIRKGFLYSILGGDRPIVESLMPNRTDQRETLARQFAGMTDIPFTYSDFGETREKLVEFINSNLTDEDKAFLFDFEAGNPLSRHIEYQEFLQFPSVQWKQLNISKLKSVNPAKHKQGIEKLAKCLALASQTQCKVQHILYICCTLHSC